MLYSKIRSWFFIKTTISTAAYYTTVGCINTFLQCIPFIMRVCLLFICLGATTDRYKGFPMPRLEGRVTMFMDFTATKQSCCYLPFLCLLFTKIPLKGRLLKKTSIIPLNLGSYYFCWEYIFYLGNRNINEFNPELSHFKGKTFCPQTPQLFNEFNLCSTIL